jgi:hypothetical protein
MQRPRRVVPSGCRLAAGPVLAIVALACSAVWAGSIMPIPPKEPAAPESPAAGSANAVLGMASVYEPGDATAGDTVVIARAKSFAAAANEPAGKGAGPRRFLATWEVLKVERGTWEPKEIAFTMADLWARPPANARGGRLMAPPYAVGRVLAFTLKTSDKPATIVAQERRSFLAPYGKLVPPTIQYGSPDKVEYDRVMKAVQDFQAQQKLPTEGGIQPVEETLDAYVVESTMGEGAAQKAWAFKIEKKTYKVELLAAMSLATIEFGIKSHWAAGRVTLVLFAEDAGLEVVWPLPAKIAEPCTATVSAGRMPGVRLLRGHDAESLRPTGSPRPPTKEETAVAGRLVCTPKEGKTVAITLLDIQFPSGRIEKLGPLDVQLDAPAPP